MLGHIDHQFCLLPVILKLFEKLFLQKLMFTIAEGRLIPNHQFGFRSKYATVEQIHRISNKISLALYGRKGLFCDVS